MQRDEQISRVIFTYATRIGEARDTDAILKLNADMARDLVGADRCSIWLIDRKNQQLWTKVAHGMDEIRIPMGQGIAGACIEGNETIVVNDTSQDARFFRISGQGGYQTTSVLAMPLHGSDGEVIGALQALNKPGGFTVEDVNLLGLAAAYSASALESQWLRIEAEAARLVMRELEIARTVQERLFPQDPPVLKGLDYAATCRPAKTVGGDYYDFIAMPGDSLFFTLGDVSGKGIAAAVLMASIQASIRSQVLTPPESFAELMAKFNLAVYSFSMQQKYSTLFCGMLDGDTRRFRYANAGQVSPMLWHASTGKFERLTRGGPPVGLLTFSTYEDGEALLEPGDTLLCYSDGISEATNENGDMWEEDAVEEILRGSSDASASELVERLISAADAFAGAAEQADDMTVVVIKALA
jgi:sigma-B regulation protein RsbU (phosphoserine phosphatase)